MGEIADMMLDGTLCEGCGEFLDADDGNDGFPQLCAACAQDRRKAGREVRSTGFGTYQDCGELVKKAPPNPKAKCVYCNKKVTKIGLSQHIRDKHPEHV